ncbi:hypothetical protein N026_14625 [Pseudomonas syringae UB303]|uniref:Uncharacterized protein n=2 Tax=Pseudomonas syringae TaxID=317 RepID=A0AAJ4B494_PSESX|nr:hypothetical protein N026_14625 [Pseudomonas syringae UB303]
MARREFVGVPVMGLTKPNQQLARDLQGLASDLKWSAVELLRIVERLSLAGNEPDAQAILKMIILFQADEDKLAAYVDEIRQGRIVRERSE